MLRIEAVLFASASPVPQESLVRVVGKGVSVDLLIEYPTVEMADRPYKIASVADAWMLWTGLAYATVIRTAAFVGDGDFDLRE